MRKTSQHWALHSHLATTGQSWGAATSLRLTQEPSGPPQSPSESHLLLFTLLPHGPFGHLLIFKMPYYSKEGLQSLWKKKRRVSSLSYFMGLHNVKQWVDFTSKYSCSIKHQVQSKLLFLIKKICKANPKLIISSYTVVQQNIYTSFQSTTFFSAAQKTCSGQTVTELYIHFAPSHVNTSALPFLNDHILK